MGLTAGERLADKPVHVVFIGSCTNARLSDLRGRRRDPARAQGRPGRAHAGRAGLAADQARGRGSAAWRVFTRRRRRVARVRLLDVPRHERRHSSTPASTASAPATATSRGGRASARARCSRARLRRRRRGARSRHRPARVPRLSPAPQDSHTEHGTDHTHQVADGRPAVHQHRHRPDHSGPLPDHHGPRGPRRVAVRRLALRRGRPAEARLRAEPAGGAGLPGAGRRPQLRLRLVARARAVGAARLRLPRRHQHRDRRHLPQQLR